MHDVVARPKGSMGVVVMLKSKMAASSGRNSKMIVSFDLSESSNKSPELLLHDPATLEHMLALLPFKFPASGKYKAILDSFVTTTTTMNVQAEFAVDLLSVTTTKFWEHQSGKLSFIRTG